MPMVQAVMDEIARDYHALDAIAVTRGPGTFPGLRIGLAAARGLALAAGLPLVGLTTLEVIAAAANEEQSDHPILAAIDARRGQVYAQLFLADASPVGDPQAMSLEAAAGLVVSDQTIFAGDMAEQLFTLHGGRGDIARGSGQPDAAVLARCAARRPLPACDVPVRPLYLRAPDATLPAGVNSISSNQ